MNLAGDFFDDRLRRSVRTTALAVIPESHVDQVVDLAINASEQALDTLGRLSVNLDHGPVGISAFGIALGLLRHRLSELEEALRDTSAALGTPYHAGTVTVQR